MYTLIIASTLVPTFSPAARIAQRLPSSISIDRLSVTPIFSFFFLNIPPPPEISPLPLHAPLPISESPNDRLVEAADLGRSLDRPLRQTALQLRPADRVRLEPFPVLRTLVEHRPHQPQRECRVDRKSTRLNSSHSQISYAVFCLKKK